MTVLLFRPFKKLKDAELLNRIYDTFEQLKQRNQNEQEIFDLCDQLILEAKKRGLSCSKEELYHRILHR